MNAEMQYHCLSYPTVTLTDCVDNYLVIFTRKECFANHFRLNPD